MRRLEGELRPADTSGLITRLHRPSTALIKAPKATVSVNREDKDITDTENVLRTLGLSVTSVLSLPQAHQHASPVRGKTEAHDNTFSQWQ